MQMQRKSRRQVGGSTRTLRTSKGHHSKAEGFVDRLFDLWLSKMGATFFLKTTALLSGLAMATLSTHGEFIYEKTVEANRAGFEFEVQSNVPLSKINTLDDCRALTEYRLECLQAKNLASSADSAGELYMTFFELFLLLAKLSGVFAVAALVGWIAGWKSREAE